MTKNHQVWEDIYSSGHANRYPWDCVVSFVFRQMPRDIPRSEIRILEMGCGSGNNVWFAAREGFTVSGIDISSSAIANAKQRFADEGLQGDLRVGDMSPLPFAENHFHLIFDHAALTCLGTAELQAALKEAHRVLKPGGKILFTPYSDSHSSALSGQETGDGTVNQIQQGTLINVGQIRFSNRTDISALFRHGWKLHSMERLEIVDMLSSNISIHAQWRVIAEKIG